MRVTLDTNVVYQAIRSRRGAASFILGLVRAEEIELAISVAVFLEYEDVLLRPRSLLDLGLASEDVEATLRFVAQVGQQVAIPVRWRPNLPDESDNMLVELAVASRSEYLITSNVVDFQRGELGPMGFEVIEPAAFARLWRRRHG